MKCLLQISPEIVGLTGSQLLLDSDLSLQRLDLFSHLVVFDSLPCKITLQDSVLQLGFVFLSLKISGQAFDLLVKQVDLVFEISNLLICLFFSVDSVLLINQILGIVCGLLGIGECQLLILILHRIKSVHVGNWNGIHNLRSELNLALAEEIRFNWISWQILLHRSKIAITWHEIFLYFESRSR